MDPRTFRTPPAALRPAPFWAMNERLDPAETARQFEEMLDAGFGGAFFHARQGLVTDYLGPDWFAAFDAALAVARRRGGRLWLYDEDLWPSGNAGGQVAAARDEYRLARLAAHLLAPGESPPAFGPDSALRYAFLLEARAGLVLEKARPLPLDELAAAAGHERLVLVRDYGPKTSRWSGESSPNLLHPGAVRRFIALTHEVYRRQVGGEFGRLVPGVFTDEPNIVHDDALPWYEGLPARYAKWTGRDFQADLPWLYFDGPEARRIRLLIHRAVLRQFVEAYTRPLYRWCGRHGLSFTGHYNAEETIASQIRNHCGGVMAHYRWMHIPGIDHLRREVTPLLLTCKQAASAARQLGRPLVLTEIFGVSRHTNTFEDFKWLGDYDLVLGANFFCPHLAWYSAKGKRKRDYPPVWNYQQTYWRDLPQLNDYFARIAGALTRGRPKVPVLLLHPVESAVAGRRIGVVSARRGPGIPAGDLTAAEILDGLMRRTLEAVLSAGCDCDLGDEGFIAESGRVKGRNFTVGRMSYRVVIVPPSFTWRETTVRALEAFAAGGGALVVLGRPPEEVDGCADPARWRRLMAHAGVHSLPCAAEAVQDVIRFLAPAGFALGGPDGRAYPGTFVQHRTDGRDEIFFIVNSDRYDARDYVLTLKKPGTRKLFRWDAADGAVYRAKTESSVAGLRCRFTLPPAGSLLLTLSPAVVGAKRQKPALRLARARVIPLPGPWRFERRDDNVLVLDRLSVSYDGRRFGPETPEWRLRREIARRFGTAEALDWQPWVAARKGLFTGRGGDIILRYRFTSELARPRCRLVLEDMAKGRVTVNGAPVAAPAGGDRSWHWDRGFAAAEIGPLVRRGENTVDFAVRYDYLAEIEAAYLVGDFGVAARHRAGVLVAEPAAIGPGSWVRQGYPFYSGRLVYRAGFYLPACRRVFLRLLNPSGVLFNVSVNNAPAGVIPWRPYELEITPQVRKNAENRVAVEVVSSLQNTWGPIHDRTGDDNTWTGPGAFENEDQVREDLSLFNYGLDGLEILVL